MIAASRSLGVLALVLAVVIHAALGWALMAQDEVEMEGGAGAQEARIGTSFADMAVGTLEAVATEEVIEPDALEALQPIPAEPVETPPVSEPLEPEPLTSEPAEDAAAMIATPEPSPVPPVESAEAIAAEDVVEAEEDQAVSRSLRPKRRSADFEKKNEQVVKKPAPKPEKPRQPKPQPRGNAEQNQVRGAATGNDQAEAADSGAAQGAAASSGNAAVSNYPGLVMKRLSRVARPRVGARGTAVVAFSVSGTGGLAGVSVARSSGSGALDRAAVGMVQRAAPFPPPPPGAQRSFSISIEGR
ncbi:energy transducer TonB [Pelagivirga sediminicola]|uniref:Energy transducer TonB n=1 Tax=Pelagivirga sediminicola TaxID=2170575 RepID=A0A2T7G837_9RHOB|nr:energy transducer TonB [Pelagivirga sediminicola]PVA10579.1 energy transducer TonB [Pelagivirga sediminicola]